MLKRILFAITLFLLVASIGYAIRKPINQAVDTTSWTPVYLNPGQTCSAYAVQARDATVVKISEHSSGDSYWTIKSNGGINPTEHHGKPGGLLFYAQSIDSETTIEVFVVRE